MKPSLILALLACVGTIGCSSGQCSNIPARPTDGDTKANSQISMNDTPTPTITASPFMEPQNPQRQTTETTLTVFKPTGQKQCGDGDITPIEKMVSALEKHKIKVFESHTQDDGLMHMQLCGAPTGQIHVLTITKKSLKQAQRLGFKLFKKKN